MNNEINELSFSYCRLSLYIIRSENWWCKCSSSSGKKIPSTLFWHVFDAKLPNPIVKRAKVSEMWTKLVGARINKISFQLGLPMSIHRIHIHSSTIYVYHIHWNCNTSGNTTITSNCYLNCLRFRSSLSLRNSQAPFSISFLGLRVSQTQICKNNECFFVAVSLRTETYSHTENQ